VLLTIVDNALTISHALPTPLVTADALRLWLKDTAAFASTLAFSSDERHPI